MSRLSQEQIVNVINHLVDGNGERRAGRLCKVDRKTVARCLLAVGAGCARILDRLFRNLPILSLELDELHTFVHTKERRKKLKAPADHGDCWGYFAMCKTSRAIICHLLGKRSLQSTLRFVAELRARTVGRAYICTDGYAAYLTAIDRSFGDEVDHLMLIKDYESVTTESGRRLANAFVKARRTPMSGNMVFIGQETAHIERFNLTVRSLVSKFGRRSSEHAKNLPSLIAHVALVTAVYNLVRVNGAHKETKTTPARVLGVIDHNWSLDELIEMALTEPEPEPLLLPAWATATRPTKNAVRTQRRDAAIVRSLGRSTEKALAADEPPKHSSPDLLPRPTPSEWSLEELTEIVPATPEHTPTCAAPEPTSAAAPRRAPLWQRVVSWCTSHPSEDGWYRAQDMARDLLPESTPGVAAGDICRMAMRKSPQTDLRNCVKPAFEWCRTTKRFRPLADDERSASRNRVNRRPPDPSGTLLERITRLLEAQPREFRAGDVAAILGIDVPTVAASLCVLAKKGPIARVGRGMYTVIARVATVSDQFQTDPMIDAPPALPRASSEDAAA